MAQGRRTAVNLAIHIFLPSKEWKYCIFEQNILNSSQYYTSMPPGGWFEETAEFLWYHREKLVSKKSRLNLRFYQKKWVKMVIWVKEKVWKWLLRHGHYGSDFGPFKMSDSCIYSWLFFFAFIPTRLSLPKLNPRTPTQTVWAKPPRTVRTEHKMSQRNLARFAGLVF